MSTTTTVELRPSKMPALAACPCYDSQEEAGEAAERGTFLHSIMEEWLRTGAQPSGRTITRLNDDEYHGIMWAVEYIKTIANGAPLELEQKMGFYLSPNDMDPLFEGTQDAGCQFHLFDLKTGDEHDYEFQMAAYAAMRCQRDNINSIRVHILYSRTRQSHSYNITREDAELAICDIVQRAQDPSKKPTLGGCSFCKWCANAGTCPELKKGADAVTAGRDDWKLDTYHAHQISDPIQMAKALRMARMIKQWAEGVEHHAKEMVNKQGLLLPGFKLQRRQGVRTVTDTAQALLLSGLSAEQFIACCTAKVGELEKALGKEGMQKLETVLKRGPEQAFFVEEKEK